MKIVKYTKLKKNKYRLLFDDQSTIEFYDDLILKHSLLLKNELTPGELKALIKENDTLDTYEQALNYLNKKLRTKKEVINYLQKKECSASDINQTIKLLEEHNLLNEAFYTECYINDQINLNLKGPEKIRHELLKLGINESLINSILDDNDPRFNENIKRIINKKVKANRGYSKRMLINKIKQDLYNRGYQNIPDSLFDIKTDEKELLKKEYNKLFKKYEHDENREYKIKQKLYQKGFDISDL